MLFGRGNASILITSIDDDVLVADAETFREAESSAEGLFEWTIGHECFIQNGCTFTW